MKHDSSAYFNYLRPVFMMYIIDLIWFDLKREYIMKNRYESHTTHARPDRLLLHDIWENRLPNGNLHVITIIRKIRLYKHVYVNLECIVGVYY